ncbi:MAG TPA: DNA methyltransferase [Burkholderiales bacterium]|nr:DNA methyltransferase [Burkholderiales bacterium]
MFQLHSLTRVRDFDVAKHPKQQQPSSSLENTLSIPVYEQELWTNRQRQASSLHEISYRACFKPQLPAYFIERFTRPGDTVYDPFSGRGTTAIEAALHGRRVIANDANPLSVLLCRPRLELPDLAAIEARLQRIPKAGCNDGNIDLSMFFHRDTFAEILALRDYLQRRHDDGKEDATDRWIRMIATNRLTGHSKGFFSVYTLPPNQAASAENQLRINRNRRQQPEYRDVHAIILKKSQQLRRNLTIEDIERLQTAAATARFLTTSAAATGQIAAASVQLTVTSPPFLDVVQYARDNWLRCWFNNIDADAIGGCITMSRTIEQWSAAMAAVLATLYRITRPGGCVAFEVGEVRKGKIRLEEHVVPLGTAAGFDCEAILINRQQFTKTANIWGVSNNRHGTNTNRIVVFHKSP